MVCTCEFIYSNIGFINNHTKITTTVVITTSKGRDSDYRETPTFVDIFIVTIFLIGDGEQSKAFHLLFAIS